MVGIISIMLLLPQCLLKHYEFILKLPKGGSVNPMSYKDFDPEIENLLISARNHVADFVGGDPYNDKVIFTSATESINYY